MKRKPFPIDSVRASVRRLMDEKGDKPKPLAEELGLSDTGIRDIFLAKTKSIGGPKLSMIAAHYGVTVEELLAGTATTFARSAAPRPTEQPSATIALPVTLPSAPALTEMFVSLLEAIDVDPHQDARAEQLALHFPHMFEATVLLAGGPGSGSRKGRAKPPRADGEGRTVKR